MTIVPPRPASEVDDSELADNADIAPLLGSLLARLAGGGDRDLLRRTIALLCQERDQGHVCVALRDWQQRKLAPDVEPFPLFAVWQQQLTASGLCNTGSSSEPRLPLVLDTTGRLYLLRHHRTEQRILQFVQERLARPPAITALALRQTLQELGLLPDPSQLSAAEPDWQLAAIAAAARSSFALLTGGPGTGKTTTVARLLAVLLHRQPDLRIATCAPTGKAAARLGEALRERATDHPHLRTAIERLQPKTLHRLLGYLPLQDAFRYGRDQRLAYDLVIVDEASMIDPAVLAALFDALQPEARLLLVGDRDQLAAVAAGQVLGDLCRAARPEAGCGSAVAAFVHEATGMLLPQQPAAPPIADCIIALRKNHRFGKQPGIGGFATALASRDADRALAVLQHGHADLVLEPDATAALACIADDLYAATTQATPEGALAQLATVRVLTAVRHGPNGAEAWNRRIEAMLAMRGVRVDDRWYQGRPVLVTQNDHQNQIWNGDLGIAWRDADGRPHVYFPVAGGPPRAVAVQRLPAHETAWAMTVHKAQGSEFQTVLLVMPDQPGPLWQASLVYTGITRARQRAILVAAPLLLRQGLGHWANRSSGLADGLGNRLATPGSSSADSRSTKG